MDDSGETLDSLYRTATEEETHTMVANWLRKTIAALERKPVPEGSFSVTLAARGSPSEH